MGLRFYPLAIPSGAQVKYIGRAGVEVPGLQSYHLAYIITKQPGFNKALTTFQPISRIPMNPLGQPFGPISLCVQRGGKSLTCKYYSGSSLRIEQHHVSSGFLHRPPPPPFCPASRLNPNLPSFGSAAEISVLQCMPYMKWTDTFISITCRDHGLQIRMSNISIPPTHLLQYFSLTHLWAV